MNNITNCKNNYFDVFVEDRKIPNPDELLGRAIKYLISKGRDISLIGFDNNGTPLVNIDNIPYSFNALNGMWDFARFTIADTHTSLFDLPSRAKKIEAYYK